MIELKDDDGFADVKVGDAQVRLDLFEAHNTYARLFDENPDPVALAQAWVDWLQGKGFPTLSHGAGYYLAKEVQDKVALLKKSFGLTSDSPDSPGSTTTPDSSPSVPAPPAT